MTRHLFRLTAGFCLLAGLTLPAAARDWQFPDFPPACEGICITGIPRQGTLTLGGRRLRPGDVLTREQAQAMTFRLPVPRFQQLVEVSYLPIVDGHPGSRETAVLAVRGRENQAPAAEDSAAETYRDLPVTGALRVRDPEGDPMTYTLTREPRRGTVELGTDGSFTYTPNRHKLGLDCFSYQAVDDRGNCSREATVTLSILRASAPPYEDTLGLDCRFSAEWMKNTGLFTGETMDGVSFFQPQAHLTRGQFLTMLVKALELPPEKELTVSSPAGELPGWLRPYVAAAIRSGLIGQAPEAPEEEISGEEAARLVADALEAEVPAFAPTPLTRAQAAELLFDVHLKNKDRVQ